MNKENLLIVMIFVVIVAGGLLFRAFYTPQISAVVNFSSGSNKTIVMYPYQKAYFPFMVKNTGTTPINNLSIGVFVGGNLTEIYRIALPPGKNLSIVFNYTALTPGNYILSAVLDPGKVYNLNSRAEAQDSLNVVIKAESNKSPSEFIGRSGALEYGTTNTTIEGYLIQRYLEEYYGVRAPSTIGYIPRSVQFFNPLINLTQNYIVRISSTYKNSGNFSELYLWMQGYLDPSIIAYFAKGLNLTYSIKNSSVGNMTVVDLGNGTTLCSWYSEGWLKNLVYEGGNNCSNVSENLSFQNQSIIVPLGSTVKNSSAIADYYQSAIGRSSQSALIVMNNTIIYTILGNSSSNNYTCSGTIENKSGREYCSTYILPSTGGSANLSLIKTVGIFGSHNLTSFALVNSSHAGFAIDLTIQNIENLGFSGSGANFTQTILGTCQAKNFSCYNAILSGNLLGFEIKNILNKSATIKTISCHSAGMKINATFDKVLSSGDSANFSVRCYDNSGVISSFVPGETLNISIGYSLNGTLLDSEGKVYVVGFG